MTTIELLLGEFIDAWNAGRRPDVDEYLERAAGTDQIVIHLGRADLVAHDDALFQFGVEAACLGTISRGRRLHVHSRSLRHYAYLGAFYA